MVGGQAATTPQNPLRCSFSEDQAPLETPSQSLSENICLSGELACPHTYTSSAL